MELVECGYRREADGRLECSHPRVHYPLGIVTPAVCGRCRWSTSGEAAVDPAAKPGREAINRQEAVPVACVHRGESLGHVPHELCGCQGRVEVVWACALHERCTVRRCSDRPRRERVRDCLSCGDYLPTS